MSTENLDWKIKDLKPLPKCNDLYALLGAVIGKEYSCPKCGKQEDEYDNGYEDIHFVYINDEVVTLNRLNLKREWQ